MHPYVAEFNYTRARSPKCREITANSWSQSGADVTDATEHLFDGHILSSAAAVIDTR